MLKLTHIKFPTIWRFLLPVLVLLVVAPLVLIREQTAQQLVSIQAGAHEQAKTLARLHRVTDELVGEQASTAMLVLKERGMVQGFPSVNGTVDLGGKTVPNLMLGNVPQANNADLVDDVSRTIGGAVTLFVRVGDDFVRIATSLRRADGMRALGTTLDPQGKVIGSLRFGRPFHGVVDVLGEPYITRYDPLYDEQLNIIGAYFVGYRADMKVLRDAVQNTRQLVTGFAMVVDSHGKIAFLSSHVTPSFAETLLREQPTSWKFVKEDIPDWNFKVIIAYPLSEARAAGLANSWFVIAAATIIGVLLITIILWQLRRLILNPIGGDPALAINVLQRIATGDLAHDGLEAKTGTLMANVLHMRRKLYETMRTLHENADRMSLSAKVFDYTHDGIFITDNRLHIVEVNPAFTGITGFTREAALGGLPQSVGFDSHDANFFKGLRKELELRGESRTETWNRRNNGEVYAAWLDMFAVRDEDNNISNFVGLFSDITQEKAQQQNLEHLAYHDALTKLPNRTLLSDRLQQALARAERTKGLLAICCYDLDGFKLVNDTLGHEAGDHLLIQLAERMHECLRESDTIARLGGDEFAVLLCNLQNTGECKQTLNRLLDAIKQPYTIAGQQVSISASIGYTLFRWIIANQIPCCATLTTLCIKPR